MGMSVNGICIKYNSYISLLPEGTDLDMIKWIFNYFGTFDGDNYYIIDCEFLEDKNSYLNLTKVLDSYFKEETDYLWECDCSYFSTSDILAYEVCEELGIEMLDGDGEEE